MNWFKKYLIPILVVLFAFSTLGARYLVGGQTFGERYPGVSPQNLVLWLDQSDVRSYGDSQTWNDISGLRNNVDQTVGANQADLYATYRDFNGTTDFLSETLVDNQVGVTFWPTYPGLTTTATAAKIRLQGLDLASLYGIASGNSTHRLVLKDSAGAVIAWGYIRGADIAEALGAESITDANDTDFDTNIGNWVYTNSGGGGNGTVAHQNGDIGGHDKSALITVGAVPGTANGASLPGTAVSALTAGKHYRLQFSYYIPSANTSAVTFVRAFTNASAELLLYNAAPTSTDAWVTITRYFSATADFAATAFSIVFYNTGTAGDVYYIDDLSVKEVTAFGTDGILMGDDIAGTNQSVTGTGAGDPNDPSTLEIYKVMGDLTGDLTVLMWVKPDDGQAAGSQTLSSVYNYGAGEAGSQFQWQIQADGTVRVLGSDDGANNNTGKVTDAAVYADGAQAAFSFIGFTRSGATVAIYSGGTAVASSNIGAGMPAGVLYDPATPFIVGSNISTGTSAANFFNGLISDVKIFTRALSAAEIQQIYLTDYPRYAQ